MSLSIDYVKVLILVSLLFTTFIFGILPVLFIRYIEKVSSSQTRSIADEQERKKSFAKYWRILGFLNCFAAGVFLATCLLELLPSVRHNLLKVMFSENIYTGFPLAEFVMAMGLFFILIIEQIALNIKENSPSDSSTKKEKTEDDVRQPLLRSQSNQSGEEEVIRQDHFLGGISEEPRMMSASSNDNVIDIANGSVESSGSRRVTNSSRLYQDSGSYVEGQATILRENESKPLNERNLHVHSVFRSMFLLFALSLHAVFEGLTLGLQTSTSDLLSIFAALAVHKSILSFSLGMNLMQSKISIKAAIKSVGLFSISAPVGLVIGLLIMDLWDSTKSGVVHGILQGFASGTFLYIIFFEILPKEFNGQGDRLLKVLYLIIGYGAITGVLFLGDDVKHPLCLINEKGGHH